MSSVSRYIDCLMQLHRDIDPQYWGDDTLGKAPHKPLLLLCVLDLYKDSSRTNQIVPSEELEAAFHGYWSKLYGSARESTFSLPFFHLEHDGFWHLVPLHGHHISDAARRTPVALRKEVAHACLDTGLHEILSRPEWRQHLRSVLIATHFHPNVHESLLNSPGH